MTHRISIITPTLNQGNYIEQCIDSVLSQDYQNLNFIIIDGGSTDNTTSIIKKYEKYISYWVSEKDHGQSDAINKGLQKADGEIINWLNSDDYLELKSLKTINNAFEDPHINVFSGRSNIVKDDIILRQSRGLDIYKDNLAKTIGLARIDQPETYWRREIIQQLGSLNSHLHYIMDRDWWIRYLISHGLSGVINTDDIIANFRLHDQSKTVSEKSSFNDERNAYFSNIASIHGIDSINKIFNVNFNNLKLSINPNEKSSLINQSINYFLFQLATEFYENSDWVNFNKVYTQIDSKHITQDDYNFLKKIKKRSSLLPSSVHQIIKKLK